MPIIAIIPTVAKEPAITRDQLVTGDEIVTRSLQGIYALPLLQIPLVQLCRRRPFLLKRLVVVIVILLLGQDLFEDLKRCLIPHRIVNYTHCRIRPVRHEAYQPY